MKAALGTRFDALFFFPELFFALDFLADDFFPADFFFDALFFFVAIASPWWVDRAAVFFIRRALASRTAKYSRYSQLQEGNSGFFIGENHHD